MLTCYLRKVNDKTFREVHTEYTTLARSHRYSRGFDGDLFFTMVDYDGGAAIFQRVCLHLLAELCLSYHALAI